MLVKLKNDWFDGQTLHRKGVTFEYNGDKANLPSSAVVLSEKGTLPVQSNSPKPGHGAKPVEEQIMDLVGAGPTHQIETAAGVNIPPAPEPTEAEKAEAAKKAEKDQEAARKDQQKAHDDAVKEAQKETEAGLKLAEKAAEKVEEAIDPLAPLAPKRGK